MADQVTSTVGGATGAPLGGITGMLQGGISNLLNMGSSWLDKILPPQKREEIKSKLTKFATEKPYLASFLFSQIALSGLPLFLFITMTLSVVIFALLVGIIVGLVGALLFILGAVGFALVILFPILFFTTFAATGIWLWGVGAYYLVKWFNGKDVPGIHVPMLDSLKRATGLDNITSNLPGQQTGHSQTNGTAGSSKTKPSDEKGQIPLQQTSAAPKVLTSQLPSQNIVDKLPKTEPTSSLLGNQLL